MSEKDEKSIFGQALPQPVARARPPIAAPPMQQRPTPMHHIAQAATPSASFWNHKDRSKAGETPLNPLQDAATHILTLLSRLRVGTAQMHLDPLRDRLLRDLREFTRTCQNADLPPQDIEDARYILSATADDIVLALPGTDKSEWRSQTITLELFGDPNPLAGFFDRLNQAATSPSKRYNILELMLTCMALGFEGQYRHDIDGPSTLVNLRTKLYERLRTVKGRASISMSHKWMPVILYGNRRQALVPLWILSGVAAAMVIALFVSLASSLTKEAQSTQNAIIRLHNPPTSFKIQRVSLTKDAPVVIYQAPKTGQLERIANLLRPQIASGAATLQDQGDFIIIRLGSVLEFKPGLAELQNPEDTLIQRIANSLDLEPGDVVVEGHSDNIPPSGAGRYKTNEALSKARAATVRDVLRSHMLDPTRISAIGVGSTKPLDNTNTSSARAKNRRVDILLRKEQRL